MFDELLKDVRPLPDTPLREVLGLIKNSESLFVIRSSLREGRSLRIRVVYACTDYELPGSMPWQAARKLINNNQATIVIDDGSGGVRQSKPLLTA